MQICNLPRLSTHPFLKKVWVTLRLYRNIGIMEKNMETTIMGYVGLGIGS